jgi:hypothetical protein
MREKGKKKKYVKPAIEHSEKINRVFLACRTQMASCTSTLQDAASCPR